MVVEAAMRLVIENNVKNAVRRCDSLRVCECLLCVPDPGCFRPHQLTTIRTKYEKYSNKETKLAALS